MHLFFTESVQDDHLVLDEEESRHALSVLRIKAGDELLVTNGRGTLFNCVAETPGKKNLVARITQRTKVQEHPHRLHIAIAPTKNIDRMEWFLEKSCEFGIGTVTPIICDRSERRELRTDRLQKILLSAMKQSLQTWLPQLREPVSFRKFLSSDLPEQRYVAHCVEGEKTHLFSLLKSDRETLVLIGPEGDFTPAEIAAAQDVSFVPVSLGEHRLRTETAGVAVAHLFGLKQEFSKD